VRAGRIKAASELMDNNSSAPALADAPSRPRRAGLARSLVLAVAAHAALRPGVAAFAPPAGVGREISGALHMVPLPRLGVAWRSFRRGRTGSPGRAEESGELRDTEEVIEPLRTADDLIEEAILHSRSRGRGPPLHSRFFERYRRPLKEEPRRLPAKSLRRILGSWGENVKKLSCAGSGTSGHVFRASLKGLERDVAIKAVPLGKFKRALNELEALKRLGGGDIVQFFACLRAKPPDEMAPHDDPLSRPHMVFFMEAADGDLMKVLQAKHELSSDVKLRILIQMLRAIVKMEKAGWVHRDIKPPNLLVFGDCFSNDGCDIKVTDFGEAAHVDTISEQPRLAGSPYYIAPEVWAGHAEQTKADIWSAGMVAFELFTGSMPAALKKKLPKDTPALLDHPFREFVPKSLDIEKDIGFQKFLHADREIGALLWAMLQKSPEKRASAELALSIALDLAERRGVEVPEAEEQKVKFRWPQEV